jgi:hypothetical protein
MAEMIVHNMGGGEEQWNQGSDKDTYQTAQKTRGNGGDVNSVIHWLLLKGKISQYQIHMHWVL